MRYKTSLVPLEFDPSIRSNMAMIFTKQGHNSNKLSFTLRQNFGHHFELFKNLMIFWQFYNSVSSIFSFISEPKRKFNPHQVLIGANNSKLKQKLSYCNTSLRHSKFITPQL